MNAIPFFMCLFLPYPCLKAKVFLIQVCHMHRRNVKKAKKGEAFRLLLFCLVFFRSILALAGGFSLLLALHAGLLIVLTTTDLGEDATAGALALPSLESAFQGFVFSDSDFQFSPSPPEPTIGAKITSTPTDYTRRPPVRQPPFCVFDIRMIMEYTGPI